MALYTAISQYEGSEAQWEYWVPYMQKHPMQAKAASKGGKSWELKHLSTNEEKSTERPKVVASEIGKTCHV